MSKTNSIGHTMRRNRIVKHVMEGKTEGRIKLWEDEEGEVSSFGGTLWIRKHAAD